jgi:hypothetical protein
MLWNAQSNNIEFCNYICKTKTELLGKNFRTDTDQIISVYTGFGVEIIDENIYPIIFVSGSSPPISDSNSQFGISALEFKTDQCPLRSESEKNIW